MGFLQTSETFHNIKSCRWWKTKFLYKKKYSLWTDWQSLEVWHKVQSHDPSLFTSHWQSYWTHPLLHIHMLNGPNRQRRQSRNLNNFLPWCAILQFQTPVTSLLWRWTFHAFSPASETTTLCFRLSQTVFYREALWQWKPWVVSDQVGLVRVETSHGNCFSTALT